MKRKLLTLLAECFLAVFPAPEFLETGLDFFLIQLGILKLLVCCEMMLGRVDGCSTVLESVGRLLDRRGVRESWEKDRRREGVEEEEGRVARARGRAAEDIKDRVRRFSMVVGALKWR